MLAQGWACAQAVIMPGKLLVFITQFILFLTQFIQEDYNKKKRYKYKDVRMACQKVCKQGREDA